MSCPSSDATTTTNTEHKDPWRTFAIVVFCMVNASMVFSIAGFAYYRTKYEVLRVRSLRVNLICCFGVFFGAITSIGLDVVGKDQMYCDLLIIASYLCIPALAIPAIVQLFRFFERSKLAVAAAVIDIDKVGEQALQMGTSLKSMFSKGSLSSFGSLHSSSRADLNKQQIRKVSKVQAIVEDEEEYAGKVEIVDETNLGLNDVKRTVSISVNQTEQKPQGQEQQNNNDNNNNPATIPPKKRTFRSSLGSAVNDIKASMSSFKSSMVIPTMILKNEENLAPLLKLISWTSSKGFSLALTILITLPFMIAALVRLGTLPYGFKGCRGCVFQLVDYIIFAVSGTLLLLLGVYMVRLVRSTPDPFLIRTQISIFGACSLIPAGLGIASAIMTSISGGDSQIAQAINSFMVLGFALMFHVLVSWPLKMVYDSLSEEAALNPQNSVLDIISSNENNEKSDNNNNNNNSVALSNAATGNTTLPKASAEKNTTSISTSNSSVIAATNKRSSARFNSTKARKSIIPTQDGFQRIFLDERLLSAFEEHLVSEFAVESLRFYLEAERWKEDFHNWTVKTQRLHARRIVKVFIGDDAVFPVNIDAVTVQKIKAQVANERVDVKIDLFDRAKSLLFDMMQKGAYRRFLMTDLYREALMKPYSPTANGVNGKILQPSRLSQSASVSSPSSSSSSKV